MVCPPALAEWTAIIRLDQRRGRNGNELTFETPGRFLGDWHLADPSVCAEDKVAERRDDFQVELSACIRNGVIPTLPVFFPAIRRLRGLRQAGTAEHRYLCIDAPDFQ